MAEEHNTKLMGTHSKMDRPHTDEDTLWELLDVLPMRVSFIDREHRHRYVNREYAEFVGSAAEQILGKTLREIYGDDEDARLTPFIDAVLRGESVQWEGWIKSPAGVDRYVRRVYKPHSTDGKEIDGYFVLVRDITEHRHAEDKQRRLSQLLRDAIENIPNGFAVYDPGERLALCNTAFASLYDTDPGSLVGASIIDLIRRAQLRLRSFDGTAVDEQLSLKHILQRLREADREPVEIELENGQWLQITSHPTADGGRVFIRTDITRLKKVERLLRESEERFRRIVERNPLPVWVNEIKSGKILYASPAATTLFGQAATPGNTRMVGDYFVDVADRDACVTALRERGEIEGYELRMRKADGGEFWAAVTARLFKHEDRELAIASIVDLTERKARESEIRQARETLEDAIESLAEGFALWDADDRLVICNQRFSEFNCLTADLLVPGVKWEEFARAGGERGQYVAARGRVEEWLEELKTKRARFSGDSEFEQSDGRWFSRSMRRTRQGGRVQIRQEITERKRMEQALRESEALFRSITLAHPVPLTIVRVSDGKILYASQALVELFQLTVEQALNMPAARYYKDPADRDRFVETLRREGAVNGFEVEMRRRDGSTFWASLTSRRIEFQGEDTIVTAIADISERQAAELELARQREALQQSEKLNALGVLLAGVAHELNNPLSVVVGQSLLLRDATTDPKTQRRADRIASAADRCSRIVKTFLAMARQSAPARKEVSLNDIVESALEITAYGLRSADIEVRQNLAADLPLVWADADQLAQVVMNLIVNAEQVMANKIGKRSLDISTYFDAERGQVQLAVRDNGPGITSEIRSRIFEPFFTTKDIGVGTGVGLSVSRGIVQAHDGSLELESEPRTGTIFVISLPRSKQQAVVPRAEPEKPTARTPHKILVVDDEPEVAEMLADILSLDGHEIEVANSGNAALRILARREFDVILSDMRMPDVDGPGLYTRIKNAYPHLLDSIVFITGDALGPSMRSFLDQTGLPYLEKPFNPKEVREIVAQVKPTASAAQ
jgi:PAS domain S-box-containing protein